MMRAWTFAFFALLVLLLPACASTRPYVAEPYEDWKGQTPPPNAERVYQVFLIGDVGGPSLDVTQPSLRLLKTRLDAADENAAVVFLGDNIYCCGLPDSTSPRRDVDERRLLEQLKATTSFKGRVVFLPGNHDWNNSRPGGLQTLDRQERYVEDYLDRGNTFLPDDGFPGPVEVKLTDRLRMLVLDTEWWLSKYEKPTGDTGEYDLEEDADFLLELDRLVKRNDDRDLLVVAHHPLFSNGVHAGFLPFEDHVFPLKKVHPALAIPLPLVGSLYPLFVRYFGGRQDLAHPRYKALRQALTQIFAEHERLIYAAGHEHNLQHFPVLLTHYIVSGAGSRPDPVGRGRGAAFSYGDEGFSLLTYYRDGSVWMEMWAPKQEGRAGTLLFRTELHGPAPELVDPGVPPVVDAVDYRDSTRTAAANPDYTAGGLKTFFLGSHHRDAWATPVEVPVLDLGHEEGGLHPVKRGGGLQTTSLRLRRADGREYVLRSIDKDPSASVPPNLQGTIATDIVQDQIASIHPYGAFILPRLADAAGVYHTNPKLVYVPSDPRLGVYRDLFAGKLAMLEERPDEDMSDAPRFGRSKDVISAAKLYREINGDNDHRVDQRAFARARLFDLLLSDWDRHQDQWRWSSFEPYELNPALEGEARTEGKVYRPVPRDRDWAFNRMNGLFPSLAGFFDAKFQDFTESYGYLPGLILNGLPQDRRLLAGLERSAFVEIADSVRAALTDAVIDEAVRDWPASIYQLNGEWTARLLKARRDKLPRIAEKYYELLAKVVDVVGSNKHERFEVTRLDDGATRVVVYKTRKDGDPIRVIYQRTFLKDETKEIRLYGLDGNDQFVVEGEAGSGIRVIAVGGAGRDTFVDHSRVRGPGRHTRFYDTERGSTWDVGRETKTIRSDDDPSVNYYDPLGYQYDVNLPLLFFGSNSDDGFFLGGGVNLVRHGFRKTPYAVNHRIKANFAARTQAFNVVYQGHYVTLLGGWDATLDAAYLSPNNIRNFYGLGNETENTEDSRRFYQARLTQARLAPSLLKRIELGGTFRFGPTFQFTRVRSGDDRFVNQPQAGVSDNTFDNQWFAGLAAEATLTTIDHPVNPTQGFAWTNRADLNVGVRNNTDTYSRLASDLALYLSPSLSPQVTLAARLGGAHNVGDFPFYSANTLGGAGNLRGFRSTRFAGRTTFYQNLDLRLQLFTFSTYFAIGKAGLLGFFDNGRVWTEADDPEPGEASGAAQSFFEGYHQGYGGGLWFYLFEMVVLNGYAGFSDDDQTFTIGLGFQY